MRLRRYENAPGVVQAVPRGGVLVAYEVANELHMPLDLVLVKKLGHPLNKEYAIGAVGINTAYFAPHDNVDEWYIINETANVRARLNEMKQKFLGDAEPEGLKGKTVIVVDDGVATGNTMLATIKLLQKSHPAKLIVAAPVMTRNAVRLLSPEADEIVAILVPELFYGVGDFYRDFSQLTDEEVIECLQKKDALKRTG